MIHPAPQRPHGVVVRRRIVAAIAKYRAEHDYPPSIRDLQAELGFSSSSVVSHHLRILEDEGRIQRDPGIARSIRLAQR